jgi:hypothetical protein
MMMMKQQRRRKTFVGASANFTADVVAPSVLDVKSHTHPINSLIAESVRESIEDDCVCVTRLDAFAG